MNDQAGEAALSLQGLVKRFGATRALDGASLVVRRGSLHGLIGQNGAGKSTIVKILNGLLQPDSGSIAIDGRQVVDASPRLIERLGVHIIHQEPMLVPGFTVAEALFLGDEPRLGAGRSPVVSWRTMRRRAEEAIASRFGLSLRGDTPLDQLGAAERQIVQITRSLLKAPRVLVFDEPTASLVRSEANRLFAIIRRLREEGAAVLYVSHYLEEVRDLCDTVTVLRNGRDVATLDPARTSVAGMAALMVDRDLGAMFPTRSSLPGAPLLEARGLGRSGAFADLSFTLRAGEILGLTGLVGSGAKELVAALFGLAPADRGTLLLHGRAVMPASPSEAVGLGIGLVPEDRRRNGVALDASVAENATLPGLVRFVRRFLLDRGREQEAVRGLIARLAIKTPGPDAPVGALSGGNQQKVSLAKWLGTGATLFLLDEPTVAVDVAAKVEIYRLLADLAAGGAGILLLSSDLAELRGLADRILVMHRGRLVAELRAADATADEILTAASGGAAGSAPDGIAA